MPGWWTSKGLTGLLRLNLCDTHVTDAGLVQLKGLSRLQTLALVGTVVTDVGVKELQRSMPNLKILR